MLRMSWLYQPIIGVMTMILLSIQEQQVQAQHGIQLTQEEYEQQCMAIDQAWYELQVERGEVYDYSHRTE
jgi:hypothetical protein